MILKTITNDLGKTKLSINSGLKGLFSGDFFKQTSILSDSDISALKAYNTEIERGASPITAYYRTMQEASDTAANMARSAGQAKVNIEAIGTTSKAAEIGLKAFAIAGNMLLFWAISKVISGIHQLITYSDTLAEKASEVGAAFKETESDIADYKTKIADLQAVINDSSSSYGDVKQARQDLMTIQDEMIEKYGDEESAIKNITDAIKGQTESLNELTDAEYQKMINKFNETDFVGSIQNSFAGSNFQQMLDNMENGEYKVVFATSGDKEFDKLLQEKFGVELTGFYGEMMLVGNLQDVYDKLLQIQELSKDYDTGNFFNLLSDPINTAEEKLNSYEDIYNAYILHDKILNADKSNNFDDYYKSANDSYAKYLESVTENGIDSEQAQQAAEEYVAIINQAMNEAEKADESGIVDYFRNLHVDLVNEVNSQDFEIDLNANTDSLKDDINEAVKYFNTGDDILNFTKKTAVSNEQINAWNTLNYAANKYHLEIEQLIEILEQLGLVESQAKQDLLNKLIPGNKGLNSGMTSVMSNIMAAVDSSVVTAWVEKLTEEEAELANSPEFEQALAEQKELLDDATLSAENYDAALQKVKDAQANTDDTSLFSSLSGTDIGERLQFITSRFEDGKLSHTDYFSSLQQEIENVDFSNYADSLEEANALSQQFFTDSIQQVSSGLS